MRYPGSIVILLLLAVTLSVAGPSCGVDHGNTGPAFESVGDLPVALGPSQAAPTVAPMAAPAPAEPKAAALPGPKAPVLGEKLGTFEFTYYWMAVQRRGKTHDNQTLFSKTCKPLAHVSRKFASRLVTEGTGKLRDGRVVNTNGKCGCDFSPCFFVVNKRSKWGMGSGGPLSPFRTVAVDPNRVAIGQLLYVAELDGLTMPGKAPWGGFVHDGCVVAGDRGGNVRGQQLDFFSARWQHYRALFRRHRLKSVTVFDGLGRCEKDGRQVVAANRNSI